ncbi:MAG: hypothetical protein JWQ02_416 [Capsulimonas sp.]|nr:hypothetical protein [Capsulimonas sp.]
MSTLSPVLSRHRFPPALQIGDAIVAVIAAMGNDDIRRILLVHHSHEQHRGLDILYHHKFPAAA